MSSRFVWKHISFAALPAVVSRVRWSRADEGDGPLRRPSDG